MRDEIGGDHIINSEFGTGRQAPVPVVGNGQGARAGADPDSSRGVPPCPRGEGDAVQHAIPPGVASPAISVSVAIADHPPFGAWLCVGPLVVPTTRRALRDLVHDAFVKQREARKQYRATKVLSDNPHVKGGYAAARNMTPQQRTARARKAALTRWANRGDGA